MAVTYQGITLAWFGHDSFRITGTGKTIWIDPWKILEGASPGEVILITHDHFDHFSEEDIRKVAGPETVVVAPFPITIPNIRTERLPVGQSTEVAGMGIEAVPAYNLDKFKADEEVYHPVGEERCGFIVTLGGVRIYHAGDTDHIPEMRQIRADVALLPVSGTYVMTADEAVKALQDLEPKLAIPMHYGAIVGSEDDARYFREQASVPVEILEQELVS